MRKVVQGFLIFFGLVGMMTCSPPPPTPYDMPNPLLVAYRHQINLDSFKLQIANDTLTQVERWKDGYILHSRNIGFVSGETRYWMNDSLLIAQQETKYIDGWQSTQTRGERALIEAEFRRVNPNLPEHILEHLESDGFSFTKRNPEQDYYRETDRIQLSIDSDKISVADTLTWQSEAFGKSVNYHFSDGKLHGGFTTIDSNGLVQLGYFRDGSETGIWEYKDSLGQLQYIEEYKRGEIQKVVHQSGATFTRDAPLPTLIQLQNTHRVAAFLIFLLGLFFLFKSIQRLRNYTPPYKDKSTWEMIGYFLIAPMLGVVSGYIALATASSLNFLMPILGWDLNIDFLGNLIIIFFFICIEIIFLWATNRISDLIWHMGLVIVFILLKEEYYFLWRLDAHL